MKKVSDIFKNVFNEFIEKCRNHFIHFRSIWGDETGKLVIFIDNKISIEKLDIIDDSYEFLQYNRFKYVTSLTGERVTSIKSLDFPQNLYDHIAESKYRCIYVQCPCNTKTKAEIVKAMNSIRVTGTYIELDVHPNDEMFGDYMINHVPGLYDFNVVHRLII